MSEASKLIQLIDEAFGKADVMKKIDNLSDSILVHILMVLKSKDRDPISHWCAELQGFINSITELKTKNNKRVTGKVLYNCLWDRNLKSGNNSVNRIIEKAKYEHEGVEFEGDSSKFMDDLENAIAKISNYIDTIKRKVTKDEIMELLTK